MAYGRTRLQGYEIIIKLLNTPRLILCIRHMKNMTITLFKCHSPEAFCRMSQLFIALHDFFIWSIVQSTLWWSFERSSYCYPYFSTVFDLRKDELSVISFKLLTIVSIMMISKWIMWHLLRKDFFLLEKFSIKNISDSLSFVIIRMNT